MADMRLSKKSRNFDRGNKGWLDDTEKRLRELDKNNDGTIDMNEAYDFMKEFEKQHSKAVTFKWIVVALGVFSVLLCVANVGTSFVAVSLSKELRVNSEGMSVNTVDGELNGVAHFDPVYEVFPADPNNPILNDPVSSEISTEFLMETNAALGDGNNFNRFLNNKDKTFEIDRKKFDGIIKSFCKGGNFKNINKYDAKKCDEPKHCKYAKDEDPFIKCKGKKIFLEEVSGGFPKKCKSQRNEKHEYVSVWEFRNAKTRNNQKIQFSCPTQKDLPCTVEGLGNC